MSFTGYTPRAPLEPPSTQEDIPRPPTPPGWPSTSKKSVIPRPRTPPGWPSNQQIQRPSSVAEYESDDDDSDRESDNSNKATSSNRKKKQKKKRKQSKIMTTFDPSRRLSSSNLPSAGTIWPSGRMIESSTFTRESQLMQDGVQHSQSWEVNMKGETGKNSAKHEWFQSHK